MFTLGLGAGGSLVAAWRAHRRGCHVPARELRLGTHAAKGS